jgi:hypothetical protein
MGISGRCGYRGAVSLTKPLMNVCVTQPIPRQWPSHHRNSLIRGGAKGEKWREEGKKRARGMENKAAVQ